MKTNSKFGWWVELAKDVPAMIGGLILILFISSIPIIAVIGPAALWGWLFGGW